MTNSSFLDSLFSIPSISGISVSPNGVFVAWSWSNIGPAADIYIASLKTNEEPRKITHFGHDTFIQSWSFDSSSLIVGHDIDGDERTTLYIVPVEHPDEIMPVSDIHPDYFIHGGELSPDNSHLFYAANVDMQNRQTLEETVIYRKDLSTGIHTTLAHPKRPGATTPLVNSIGTHVIYTRRDLDPRGTQIWLVDIQGSEDREILNFGPDKNIEAAWLSDGKRLVFTAETDTHRKLGIWHLRDSSIEWLIDNPDKSIDSFHAPFGSNEIVIQEIKQAVSQYSFLSLDTHSIISITAPRTFIPLVPFAENAWVGALYNATTPTDIVVLDITTGAIIRSITNTLGHLPSGTVLPPAQSVTWNAPDGVLIQGWLYTASGETKGAILYIHGGPTYHHEDKLENDIAYLVHVGFNVLDVNYRGSTGFGLAYENAILEDGWGGREQVDISSGAKFLIEKGFAAPGKIGIMGTSYGGYSSWYAITHFPPELIKAAIPICGMTDLTVDYETTRPDLRPYSEKMMGGTPAEIPEKYRDASPLYYIKNIKGNLLIVQGAHDPNVTPENVAVAEKELISHGILYEKLVFPDEGHGIQKPDNQKKLLIAAEDFFKRAFS